MVGPHGEQRIWTLLRKVVPNLLPLLVGIPFWVFAAILGKHGFFADSIELAALGLIVCALSLNWLGVIGNASMRQEAEARFKPAPGSIFVGISRPGFVNWLDPHEDIGFLSIEEDQLVICGEKIKLQIPRSRTLRIGFAFNPHAALGLGQWITIRSESVGVFIEPREAPSLRANRKLGVELRSRLEMWARH